MTHVSTCPMISLAGFSERCHSCGRIGGQRRPCCAALEPPPTLRLPPLPPGAVEPAGWLRDWCLAARDGFTGHMDEYDDEFKRAWAPDHQMTGEGLLWYKGAWPYEGGGYWFDGLARLGFALHDEALIQQAKRRLYAVADHMNTNGLLFLWWLDRNNPGRPESGHRRVGGLAAVGLRPAGARHDGILRRVGRQAHSGGARESLRQRPGLPAVDHRQHVESVAGF